MKNDFQYRLETLAGGLRLLTLPMTTTGAATVMVFVGAGSRYEDKSSNGVAHYLEHLFFKGGRKYKTFKEVVETLDAQGAVFNAETSAEYAAYYVKTVAEENDVQIAFDVLSDMLIHARLPQKEINKERGVILEEYRMYKDLPMQKIGDVFEGMIFRGSPLGLSTIGEMKVIQSLGRRDFVKYLRGLYTPDNIVVAVAGKISHAKAKELTKKYFRFPRSHKILTSAPTKMAGKLNLELVYKDTEQTHLILGVPAFSATDPRRHAIKVMANILGGSMSSRMFIAVREKHGLAYYVHTSDALFTDAGYLATAAGVDNRRAAQAVELILQEYKKITKELVGAKELRKAKEKIKGGLVLNLEGSNSLAGYFGLQELLLKRIESPQARLKKIAQVTASDVRQVARDIFKSGALQMAIIGPHKNKEVFLKILRDAGKKFSVD